MADFINPGQIVFRDDATRPDPGPGEVLVAVEACGICGSDLHMYRNGSLRERLVRTTPEGYQVPGHEFAGTIAALGEGVRGWAVGERVVGVTGMGGGMADYVVVPVNPFQLVKMPDGVSFVEAATTEPLADALQMVRKAGIKSGENVVVFGVGIIGLGLIQVIRALGIEVGQLVAIDVQDVRLQSALTEGATATINPRNGDVFEQVAALCGRASDYQGESAGVDVVIDCAGYIAHMQGPPPLETALALIRPNTSRIVCFGAYEDKLTIDLMYLIRKQPTIYGSVGYASEELAQALELMRTGAVNRNRLISHRFSLESVTEAFDTQAQPTAVKVVIEIGEGPGR